MYVQKFSHQDFYTKTEIMADFIPVSYLVWLFIHTDPYEIPFTFSDRMIHASIWYCE